MSRYRTTNYLPDELLSLCDGWHGHGQLSDLHRDMIFHVCAKFVMDLTKQSAYILLPKTSLMVLVV